VQSPERASCSPDRLHGVALACPVEGAAVAREHLLHAHRSPGRNIGDLVGRRCGERVEDELVALRISHVHAVESEYVEVHIQPESFIRPTVRRSSSTIRSIR